MIILDAGQIAEAVYHSCIEINLKLRSDILSALKEAYIGMRRRSAAKEFLGILLENASIAKKQGLPLCQDTGMVVVFLELGRNTCIRGDIEKEINKAVARAYKDGGFRASIVKDPVYRGKSGFSPAIIHTEYTSARSSYLTVLAKGFGSENKSRLKMMLPTATPQEVVSEIVDSIVSAGPAACPPFVVGVGIGGTSDKAAFLAKKALTLPIGPRYRARYPEIRKAVIKAVNASGIGVLGLGEGPTILGLNILSAPTHIAGLPLAVNIGCHSTRSKKIKLV